MVDVRTKRKAYAYRGAETGTKTAAVLNESHSLNYERNRFLLHSKNGWISFYS